VLFVGAHADDIELIAGGLLAQRCFDSARVGVLVFSAHEGPLTPDRAEIAHREFRDNMTWLAGEAECEIVDHTSRLLRACRGEFEAERGWIYSVLESLRDRYDAVVTHAPSDTNQDHQQVAAEAMRVFKAHATLLAGEFPNNDLGESRASVYVALSTRAVDAKVRMIDRYASQRFDGRPYFDADVVRGLARVRGSQIREQWAEAFSVPGRVIARAARVEHS
jgi:LmbE family N-acetylglucosaminyl deacetylase